MSAKIIPLVFLLSLVGCGDVDTLTRADRTRAEAQRLTAQAASHDAEARLTGAQALSITLATTTRHAERMTQEALSRADQLSQFAWTLGFLIGIIAGCVVVLALVLRAERRNDARRHDAQLAEIAARLRNIENAQLNAHMRQLPPEQRARVRALLHDAQTRESR